MKKKEDIEEDESPEETKRVYVASPYYKQSDYIEVGRLTYRRKTIERIVSVIRPDGSISREEVAKVIHSSPQIASEYIRQLSPHLHELATII